MNEDITLLKNVFDSSKRTSTMLGAILAHVENKSLRTTIISQINKYDDINRKAGEEILSLGMKPKSGIAMRDKISVWGKNLSIGINPSLSHIAEIISKDANTSTTEINRTMNHCINSSPKAYNLARMLVNADNASAENIKNYL